MTRRAHGEGSIYQRVDGKWCAQLRYEDPLTGVPLRVSFYGRTKTEVRGKLRDAAARVNAGSPARDSKVTLAQWLETWKAGPLAASTRKPTTKALYTSLAETHLEPAPLGALPLDKLRPSHVHKLIVDKRGVKLSESTLRQVYNVLRLALDDAVREGLTASNVCEKVPRPKAGTREARFLSTAEVAKLIEAAQGTRYQPVLALIALTGMRRGEALALKWSDIDFEERTLSIRGTLARVDGALTVSEPKTERSRRVLPLSPAVSRLLEAHRRSQRVERMRAANIWTETGHVFTTETGRPVDPRNVFRALQVAAKKVKIEGIGLHTLRHSAATAMLENGVNLKAVSAFLGHSSIAITGDIYGHVTDDASRAAANALADAIGM